MTIGGAAATSVVRVNANQITAVTPTGTAGDQDVVVTNNDGQTATGTGSFTYIAPPIAGFSGTPVSGQKPLNVAFTDSSTGIISSYSWNFGDGTTSTLRNPSHQYTTAGSYGVNLTVTGPGGSDLESKTNYITVTNATTKIGIYKDGVWYLDLNGNGGITTGIDKPYIFGTTGWTKVVGDWNGDGTTKIGLYKDGTWYLDWNGNGAWDDGTDKVYIFGTTGWTSVVGDWNGDGTTKIGLYKDGAWYLDWNGNGAWDDWHRQGIYFWYNRVELSCWGLEQRRDNQNWALHGWNLVPGLEWKRGLG